MLRVTAVMIDWSSAVVKPKGRYLELAVRLSAAPDTVWNNEFARISHLTDGLESEPWWANVPDFDLLTVGGIGTRVSPRSDGSDEALPSQTTSVLEACADPRRGCGAGDAASPTPIRRLASWGTEEGVNPGSQPHRERRDGRSLVRPPTRFRSSRDAKPAVVDLRATRSLRGAKATG
jgi:hypothetical protein